MDPVLLPLPPRSTRLVGLVVLAAVMLVCPAQSAMGAARFWQWPTDPPGAVAHHVVVRPFIAPATAYGAGHRGIDVAAPVGAPVYAPADGTVHFVGVVVDRPVLSIQHPDGLISSFEPVVSSLAVGAVVRRGELVGTLLPGHCAAPCLHFGARLHGQYVSPLNYLDGIPRSVLLPTRPLH